jgi:hypothetical protein
MGLGIGEGAVICVGGSIIGEGMFRGTTGFERLVLAYFKVEGHNCFRVALPLNIISSLSSSI